MHEKTLFIAVIAGACLATAGCKGKDDADKGAAKTTAPDTVAKEARTTDKKTTEQANPDALPPLPKGLAPLTLTKHEHNPTTMDKAALGELLFFDTRLSDSGTFACVNCHLPDKGWTDGLKLSPKFNGKLNSRHSPTLYNVGFALDWYWDGRMDTLEKQILAAWTGQAGATPEQIATKLAEVPTYKEMFEKAFGEGPTPDNIPMALASFLRVKLSVGDAPWDRYQAGDKSAVSEDAIKGYAIFTEKAKCVVCHAPPLFTDMKYHNIGVGYEGAEEPDVGRFKVSQNEAETGAFKTPGLRNVTLTAPYFHDGSADTLDAAVDFMLAGGYRENNKHIDPLLQPVQLTGEERKQLMAFIESLTETQDYTPPALP